MYLQCRYIKEGKMETRIQKWGNSLALRIPKTLADQMGLGNHSRVEVTLRDNELVIAPAAESAFTLEKLLAGIRPDNLHGEVDTGPAVGREVW
jgi:antitoxin MazE